MGHKQTSAQQNIYNFIKNGSGNGIIDAVAGAGKTTTLMNCVMFIPDKQDVVYCAFNSSIRKEIKKKFHDAKIEINVCTIHSLGFQMLRATRDYVVDDFKYNHIINDPQFLETLEPDINRILGFHGHPSMAELRQLEERRNALDWHEKNDLNEGQKYVGRIISRLLDINQKYRCTLEEDNVEHYDAMIRHFGIIPQWEQDYHSYSEEVTTYFRMHQKLLKEGNSMAISHGIIDFTDQLYLPYHLNLTTKKQYGFVFVDECQDLSKAQVKVVEKYLRKGGRLLAVGDPFQAIYGFAGADCNSFDRVQQSFNCTRLGLSDCFRCPKDVITLAQSLRCDIKGFKEVQGKLYKIPFRDVTINIKPGDLVICRTRLPLRGLALKLINKDYKVRIHPDELQEFIGDYKRNFTDKEIRKALNDQIIEAFFEHAKERNRKRIAKENQNADAIIRKILIKEEVATMETTLDFLKRKYFDWRLNTLELILKRLKLMLSNPSDDAIKISTIHRAKGLENDRVFILDYDKLPPPRDIEWENIQERNLHYVAVTRPREELYLCDSQKDIDFDEPDDDAQPAQPINVVEYLAANEHNTMMLNVESIKDDSLEVNQDANPFQKQVESEIENDSQQFLESLSAFDPISPFSLFQPIKIRPVQIIKKVPEHFYAFDEQEDTPYENLNNHPFQKAKYWSVYNNLQDTEFSIDRVVPSQYLDAYHINTPNGIEIYNGYYKNSGQYKFAPQGICINAEEVMCYLENESSYKIKFDYNPMNRGFDALHQLIQAECHEHNTCITNIYEENYTMVYCFKTSCSYAYLKIMYNGKKLITNIAPFSTLGEDDEVLKTILESLTHLWQR